MAGIYLQHITKVFETFNPRSVPFGRMLEGYDVEMTGSAISDESVAETTGVARPNAVDDVSLLIKDGETMSIIGPSGCGKTTLLRIIAGLEAPSSGRVFYDNTDVTDVPVRERVIGMVFQNYALYPHMSSKRNLGFFFQVHKREPEVEERVQAVVEIMGAGFRELLNRNPKTLSGGQKQRVAIARCIIREPRLFLFDEPLSNLDAKLRSQTRVEIKRLLRRFGITAVYVTHDQTEAIALGDRIAVMRDGRIEQVGTYWEVHDKPQNAFVAGFVGTPSMNLLRAEVNDATLRIGSATLALNPAQAQAVQDHTHVILGVRPQHLNLADHGLTAMVYLVEQLPSDHAQYVHARLPDRSSLTAKLGQEHRIIAGEQIYLQPDLSKIHLFGGPGERRLE